MQNTTNTSTSSCYCNTVGAIAALLMFLVWIMGAVIAKGFWSTVFSIFFPPWAWYLFIERAMSILLGPSWL